MENKNKIIAKEVEDFKEVYLENFQIYLRKPMDIASVFHSRDRLNSFLTRMIEQAYQRHNGIFPIVYEEKHRVFNMDYMWLFDCLVLWLSEDGRADISMVRAYIRKYFVPYREEQNFGPRFLFLIVFGLVHDIRGGFLPDFSANKKRKYYKNKGRDNSYLGGIPFFQPTWYFDSERDVNFEFKCISLKKNRLMECTEDAGDDLIYQSKKCDLKQVAFSKKQVKLLENEGEKAVVYYIISRPKNAKSED